VLDENAQLVEMTSYKWYGSHLPEYEGSADNAWEKFTGKELDTEGADAENGVGGILVSYFGARYYDAEIGVFTSTDPIEEFWNAYAYGPGNPINGFDPDGNHWEVDKKNVVTGYWENDDMGVYFGPREEGKYLGDFIHDGEDSEFFSVGNKIALNYDLSTEFSDNIALGTDKPWYMPALLWVYRESDLTLGSKRGLLDYKTYIGEKSGYTHFQLSKGKGVYSADKMGNYMWAKSLFKLGIKYGPANKMGSLIWIRNWYNKGPENKPDAQMHMRGYNSN